ncbi:MAG: hypothetical protein ACYTG2_11770 [Planctomycetota bacterium]|jgi:hypothetical protein
MLRQRLILTLGLLPAIAACSTTTADGVFNSGYDMNRVQRVAIVDGGNSTYGLQTRQALIDTFQMEFMRQGWSIVSRVNIERVFDEIEFQNQDITSDEGRRKLGSILNVQALTIVNVAQSGDVLSLTAEMTDVETGDVIWIGSGEGSVNSGLSTTAGVLGGAIVGAAIGHNSGDNAGVGAVVGGVAGGAMGNSLAPSQMENAKLVVRKVCESLPKKN